MAPVGYHVPSNSEWNVLSTYLGGDSLAGGKLKETDTIHWWSPNYGATNSTGFAALPSGGRANYGVFSNIGAACILWSSSELDSKNAIHRSLTYDKAIINIVSNNKGSAFSVRCIKNN